MNANFKSRFGPSFNVFSTSQRQRGCKALLKDSRIFKNIITRPDFKGIRLVIAFHKRGFLFLDWHLFNSWNQCFSASSTRTSALKSSRRGNKSLSVSGRLLPTFNTSFIHQKKMTDSQFAASLGFCFSVGCGMFQRMVYHLFRQKDPRRLKVVTK